MPIELLNRGLHSAVDPTLLPPGALQAAENARYRSGDPAIWQAEGRAEIASGHAGVTAVAGLAWDPGTTVDGANEELKQLLLIETSQLRTVAAKSNPADPAMSFAASRLVAIPAGASIGTSPLVTVQLRNTQYLLSGAKNIRVKRGTTGQTYSRHGFPSNTMKLSPVVVADVTGVDFKKGHHYFWFTWYDSVNDIESTADIAASQHVAFVTDLTDQYIAVRVGAGGATGFDAAVPSGANAVRVYKSKPHEPDLAGAVIAPATNAWPVGYRIGTFAFVVNANGLRFPKLAGADLYIITNFGLGANQAVETNLGDFPLFDFYSISIGGVIANFGVRGEPPSATTGDVFEESVVLNDLANKRSVRYSAPVDGDAFPSEYFIAFDTAETDEVRAVRRLGNKLGVFLRHGVWRVNWLPLQSDFDFSRGRVTDEVFVGLGAEGHYSVAKFNYPGKGPLLAWFARNGLVYATDLYDVVKLTPQIAPGTFGHAPHALFDDPDNERLVLVVGPQLWFLHYDEAHVVDGALAVTGPMPRPALVSASGAVTVEGGARRIVTVDASGKPYYEGFGFADGDLTLGLDVLTRDIYPAGLHNEVEAEEISISLKPAFGAASLHVFVDVETSSGSVPKSATFTPQGRTVITLPLVGMLERFRVGLNVTDAPSALAVNYVDLETVSAREAQG